MRVETTSEDSNADLSNDPAPDWFHRVDGAHRRRSVRVTECVPEGVARVLSCATETPQTAPHIHTSYEQVIKWRGGEGTTHTPVK